ncbi:MAG: tetratricopeptide repeat protein, partial [bacterium]
TCNFLRYFVRNIADVPLTVLGGYRPEELVSTGETEPPSTGLFRDLATEPNFETLTLAPLSARESFNLIECACGQAVSGELAPLMYQKTEGNPYYLFECINVLRGDGIILGKGIESRIASGVSEISIPSNVAELLKSRLARLNNEDRELLEYASIIGPVFTSEFLTPGDEAARLILLRQLNKIEREHRIIRSRESGYAFDHHLLYEYVYQSIAPDLRAAFHREIASRIEKYSGAEPGEDIVYMLADHYSRGLDHARASEYLLRAARLSMAKYSGTEAQDALNRARSHFMKIPPERRTRDREWDFALLASEIASHLGNNEREEKAIREMEKLAEFFPTSDEALDVAEHRANFALSVSKFDSALADFETAKNIARETGDLRRVAKIANRIGMTYREMMRWDDAMRNLEEALQTAKSLNDSHLVGCILKDIGTVNTKQTRWREASMNLSEALPLLREAGDRREEAFALNGLAVSLFCGGDQDAALQRWEEANRIFESIGYPSGQSNILHNLGVTYANLGQIDRAIDCLRSALKLRRSIGMRHAQVSTLTRLGFVYFMIGAFDRAAENLRSALTIARELGADLVCIEIYYHFTELSIALGDFETAADHIMQAWKTLGSVDDPYHRAHLHLAGAMLALEKKDYKTARQCLDAAWAEDFNDPQLSSEIAVYGAWAEQGKGQTEKADRYIEQYVELSKGCPFIYARITGSVILHTVYEMRKDKMKQKAASDTLKGEHAKIDSGTTDPSLREAFQSRWGKYLFEQS